MKSKTIRKFLHPLIIVAGLWLGVATASQAAETVVYYHTDALGSPVAETNVSGQVIAGSRREYEPYGYQLSPQPLEDGPGYTGHVSDAATGFSYMQQRYYDPGIGRFLSVDPVTALQGGPQHFNRYDYANDNPVRNTDPDGRQSVDFLGLTNEQLRSISTNSMVQARLSAAEEFVAPKSVSVEVSGAVSGGSPVIGGAAQLLAGVTLGQGSDGGAAASVYGSGGIEATSAIKEVGTVSYPLGGDGANVGGSVGLQAALSISNAPVSGVGGTSVVHNISTPIGGVSWSVGSNGIWSAGVVLQSRSKGVSYSKITVKTKVLLSTECKAPCN